MMRVLENDDCDATRADFLPRQFTPRCAPRDPLGAFAEDSRDRQVFEGMVSFVNSLVSTCPEQDDALTRMRRWLHDVALVSFPDLLEELAESDVKNASRHNLSETE